MRWSVPRVAAFLATGADFEDGFARLGVDNSKQAGDDGFVAQEVLAEVFGGFDFVHRMSM